MSKKLFDGEEEPRNFKPKENKQFAGKLKKKKEREMVDKVAAKDNEVEEEQKSSDSQEDENGQLINENVTSKFIETMAKIRFKHPDIYKVERDIFEENEENQSNDEEGQKTKNKKLTYAQLTHEQIKERIENGDSDVESVDSQNNGIGKTPEQEQQQLKQAFKQAAQIQTNNEELLKKKHKTQKEILDENEQFSRFMKSNKNKNKDLEILEKFWGDEEKLDENEKFLRKYILTQGWIDRENMSGNGEDSEEDEERMDKFEEKYNFRFEEPGGAQITTYERNITDTVRQEEVTARKRQREAKAQRKLEQKKQLEEELRVLKKAKKNEIIQKIQKIQQVSGMLEMKGAENLAKEMEETEFNADRFDAQMGEIFDEDYYAQEESLREEDEEDEEEDSKFDEDIQKVIEVKEQIPKLMKKSLKDEELKALKEEEVNIWWYCDGCKVGIEGGQWRFDCQECEDYTLCQDCKNQGLHNQHKLKRFQVALECQPPDQKDVKQILNQFQYCGGCEVKLSEWNDYYERKKDGAVLCVDCFDKQKSDSRAGYKKVNAKMMDLEETLEKDADRLKEQIGGEIGELVDEYYGLDFEDVIAGGIKTRFKYVDVEREDWGLSDDDLLYCDDQLLNKYVSIRKLAPYRQDRIKMSQSRMRSMLKGIKSSAKRNKKLLFKEEEKIKEGEERVRELEKRNKRKQAEEIRTEVEKLKELSKVAPQKRFKKMIKEKEKDGVRLEKETLGDTNTLGLKQDRLKSYGVL